MCIVGKYGGYFKLIARKLTLECSPNINNTYMCPGISPFNPIQFAIKYDTKALSGHYL